MGSGGKGKRGRGEQVETVLLPVIKISALSAGAAAGGLGLKPGDQRQYLTEPSTKAAENRPSTHQSVSETTQRVVLDCRPVRLFSTSPLRVQLVQNHPRRPRHHPWYWLSRQCPCFCCFLLFSLVHLLLPYRDYSNRNARPQFRGCAISVLVMQPVSARGLTVISPGRQIRNRES